MKENTNYTDNEKLSQYLNMMEKLLVPVLITSKKTRTIVYANKYACEQYETTLDKLINSNIDLLYTDEKQKDKILNSFNEIGRVESLEMEFKTHKGNIFTGLLSLIEITYNDDLCYFGHVKDISLQKKQQNELEKLNKELDQYKNELEKLVEIEVKKRQESEKIIMRQANHVAMGEMIDAVAHQWKQPITIMSLQVEDLIESYKYNELDINVLEEFRQKFNMQKNLMIDTLQEFRDFLRPNKDIKDFSINGCVKSVSLLLKDELLSNQIFLINEIEKDFNVKSVENEFKHTIINLINNSKDAFKEKIDEEIRKITIYTISNKSEKKLIVEDNAGGIPLHIIDDIFNANVTSKESSGGTGIGLYMTKQILDKYNISISCENIDSGARFIIDLSQNNLISL